MSSVIHIINGGVRDAIEQISYSHSLYLTGIILPVWDSVDISGEDIEFLQNTQPIGIERNKQYGRPVIIDGYRVTSTEGYTVKPTLLLIRCESNGIISYNVLNAAAGSVFDTGCDVLYVPCDFIEKRIFEALIPTFGRLCRWASSKFEGVYISSRNSAINKKLKSNTESKDCSVMLL